MSEPCAWAVSGLGAPDSVFISRPSLDKSASGIVGGEDGDEMSTTPVGKPPRPSMD
ncbi:hypothetical protein BD289DRAFT_439226 [Coniella lustricola]|uniref:Uncharacterized protein n=1 Tax=Coniella lustricola TaxID=2025994 RepID=A0A2T3A1W4_9PEZI|nr:hypothetical protein BD289DRAFT_439226 [Coniella lustricola]